MKIIFIFSLILCLNAFSMELEDISNYGLEFAVVWNALDEQDNQKNPLVVALEKECEEKTKAISERLHMWHTWYKKYMQQDPMQTEKETFHIFLSLWFLR